MPVNEKRKERPPWGSYCNRGIESGTHERILERVYADEGLDWTGGS